MTMPKAAPAAATSKPRTPLVSVKRERINAPHLIVLHGLPGFGKTSFAAQFPDPLFICAEKAGAHEQLIYRYPDAIDTWDELLEAVRRLTVEDHSFKTLVIDKLEDIEPLCWAHILANEPKNKKTMAEAFGGYEKGYQVAVDLGWRLLAARLEQLQAARGMNLVLISHATRRKFNDPTHENYDRWEPNVDKRAAAFFVGWARTVLFMDRDVIVGKLDDGDKAKGKVLETGARVMRTEHSAAYDAKNRLTLPAVLPMGTDALSAYEAWRSWTDPEALKKQIAARVEQLADAELGAKVAPVVAEAGDFSPSLAVVLHRLNELVRERGKGA
jgi:hypothetical protein